MKKLLRYTILYMLAAFAFASCSKNSSSPGPILVSAKVNGNYWGAYNASVTFNKVPTLDVIIHAQLKGSSVNFELSPYSGRGIYLISGTNNAYYESNGIYNHANTGQVEITDCYSDGLSKTIIKGTFNFATDNNISLTEGVFEVAMELN